MTELVINFTEAIKNATTVDELKELLIDCMRVAAEAYNKGVKAENLVKGLAALDKAYTARAEELISMIEKFEEGNE